MDSANSLVNRVVQDSLPVLADHARIIQILGGKLETVRAEFVVACKANIEREPALGRLGNAAELAQDATHGYIDPLAERDLSAYLVGIADWSETWRARGANFADGLCLMGTLHRTLIPFLLREYSAGPELELVFRALDVLERATLNVLSAAEIQATQNQLLRDAHRRTVGRLTGGMAHALNNTLAILVGRAQILEEQVGDQGQRAELGEMQRIARAGADSLKHLQSFAVEHESSESARWDVNAIVRQVAQLTRFRWRDDAQASGIQIQVAQELAPVSPVIGQGSALRDALVELILNSIDAMPLGGTITIRTEQAADRVRVIVLDEGQGMETETLARATESLFTTRGSGHAGLGLTVVKTIAQQMGGTLSLASAPGQGTRATIELPAAREIQQAADYRPARLARWTKILVVDDEPLVRDVAARSFERRGFQTVSADSGEDAVRLCAAQGPFEVAIVDLGMPRMNGFETARAIKQLNPRTIVILMTGWSAELDPGKMRETGVDRAIAKPFDVDRVIELIGEALSLQDKL
ncbi:MAG: response regulator [Anaerolineae bacterium]|nr:response regulator [Anaerolineae bacterium]